MRHSKLNFKHKTKLNALISKGIDKSRFALKGWKQTKPIDANKTENGKAKKHTVRNCENITSHNSGSCCTTTSSGKIEFKTASIRSDFKRGLIGSQRKIIAF